MRTTNQRAGDGAEDLVARRLIGAGWTLLGRQVRVGRAELDLVAIDPGPPAMLVVLEVRWRGSRAFGLVEESIDWRKAGHLRVGIGRLLEDGLPGGRLPRLPFRIDLVVVEPGLAETDPPRVRHHRSAV